MPILGIGNFNRSAVIWEKPIGIAPYLTRKEALFSMSVDRDNKGDEKTIGK